MEMKEVFFAAAPFAVAWVVWVSKSISAHSEIIKKMDQLVSLLLDRELNQKG